MTSHRVCHSAMALSSPLGSAQGLSDRNKNPANSLISEKMSDRIRKSHFKLSWAFTEDW